MSTLSGVSGTGDAWSAMKTQRSQMQTKMFAKIDTDSSGSVDKTELSAMLSKVSQKAGVTVGGDTDATFTQMDSNTNGQLSSDELAKGMQSLQPPPSTMDFAQSRGANGTSGTDQSGDRDDLFGKIDTNGDGAVDQTELTALTDKIKADTGKDTTDMFAKLDADKDGKLSQTEFEAGRPTAGADATGKPVGAGGPPPPSGAGGPGGPGGAGKTDAAANKTYDKLDTNQDRTVSEMERLVGALKDAAEKAVSNSTDTSAGFDVAKLAKMVYDEVSSGFLSQSSSALDAVA